MTEAVRDEVRVRDAELHQRLWPDQTVEWAFAYLDPEDGDPIQCCAEADNSHQHPKDALEPFAQRNCIPEYSSDGNAMLAVIERMRERGFRVTLSVWPEFQGDPGGVMAAFWRFGDEISPIHEAPTAPEAVALAAKAALTAREGGAS